jgi:hypothetical protein
MSLVSEARQAEAAELRGFYRELSAEETRDRQEHYKILRERGRLLDRIQERGFPLVRELYAHEGLWAVAEVSPWGVEIKEV